MIYVEIIRPGNHATDTGAWAQIHAGFTDREAARDWAYRVLAPGIFFRLRQDGVTLATDYVPGAEALARLGQS